MSSKLYSRKFWIAVAAFLASLGTGITGLCTDNEAVAMTGGILCVVSAAIYAFCEAYVDASSIKSDTHEYVETIAVQSNKADAELTKAAATKITSSTSSTTAVLPVVPDVSTTDEVAE